MRWDARSVHWLGSHQIEIASFLFLVILVLTLLYQWRRFKELNYLDAIIRSLAGSAFQPGIILILSPFYKEAFSSAKDATYYLCVAGAIVIIIACLTIFNKYTIGVKKDT